MLVGALTVPLLWFASRDAFGSGELCGDATPMFTMADAIIMADQPDGDGHGGGSEHFTLEELKEMDVEGFNAEELAEYTARLLDLEAFENEDGLADAAAAAAPSVSALAALSEAKGDLDLRRVQLEFDREVDFIDALAQAALLASCD